MIKLPQLEIPSEYQESVEEAIKGLVRHRLIEPVLKLQKSKFSKELQYHSYQHVLEVLYEVTLLGMIDCLTDTEIELLAIAAAFHDAGFIERRVSNEPIGASMASKAMYDSGDYSKKERDLVHQMIMDTALIETPSGPKQMPSSHLSGYLLDADLANFGRKDFLVKAELQRRESGQNEDIFYQKTLELVQVHSYFTSAAKQIRNSGKNKNVVNLQKKLVDLRRAGETLTYFGVSLDRLGFLTQLPVLLNSSLETKKIISKAILHLQHKVRAEAVTIFIKDPQSDEIEFWVLEGGSEELTGRRLRKGSGIVGWVIEHQESVLVSDVTSDPRFIGNKDNNEFITRDMICVPLVVRGSSVLGALQILNSKGEQGFQDHDRLFVEHVSRHLAPALENARMFELLEKQNRQLAKIESRRSELAALIAHEFRTPLNVIRSAASLLSTDVEEKNKELTELLESGVDRMVRLIDQVRNLSIVSGNSLDTKKEQVNIVSVFSQLSEHFSEAFQRRELELVVNASDLNLVGDKKLITIALQNLIANAIRFTPNDGTVILEASEKSGLAEIAVIDNGVGIDPSDQEVIFQKFYEVRDIKQHSSGNFEFNSSGLGLGLSTVKAILEAHGSSMQLTSTPGKGSRFCFRLPIATIQAAKN